jgi:hypothetical protein
MVIHSTSTPHKAGMTILCLFAKPNHHRIWHYILGIFLVVVTSFVPIDSYGLLDF